MDSVHINNPTEQAKSKKRDCDEMFLPLSDDAEEDEPNPLDSGLYTNNIILAQGCK